jgi:hypothetical protein
MMALPFGAFFDESAPANAEAIFEISCKIATAKMAPEIMDGGHHHTPESNSRR